MKHCIFYLPYELDPKAARARMVRPRKMVQAFRKIGYDVFEITGFAQERSTKIEEAKRMIRAGTTFDFMYSEASTMPTLLTQPHHLPTHPFLDFGFFRFLKQHDVPIGLFYPDVYWKFEFYGEGLPKWKRFLAIRNYELDIRNYEKYLDCFYVPSLSMCKYLKSDRLTSIARELPPGADDLVIEAQDDRERNFAEKPLTIFYVGGVGAHYQIDKLAAAVADTPHTRLILCCREAEWNAEKAAFEPLLNDQITIIHKSGEELEPYYSESDLCSLLFQESAYRELAKPVKAYEYLAHERPVLATKGTGIGDYVEETGIGWTLPYEKEAISAQLQSILNHPEMISEKRSNCKQEKGKNIWEKRALQVAENLIVKG